MLSTSTVPVLVGGVSQLFQGDLDVGRRIVEALGGEDLGPGVLVEDLHYGAVAVAQRLQELRPGALVLVGGEQRGRSPGTVERVALTPRTDDVQVAVAEAVQGYVSIDLVVDVAAGLDALPPRVTSVELEPVTTETSLDLSPAGARAIAQMLALVREEVRYTPLLVLVTEVRRSLAETELAPSRAVSAVTALLVELDRFDRERRWGRVFAERDRLRAAIAEGHTSEAMTHLDWGLWWALIEELDRLQRLTPPEAGEA